ncbi:hypothetical protein ACA351_00235 [Orientia tsutsugamushi]|uniref:hypothetical protein n=1 Tax=Orientia tsutsugamushi TaxID=784 RepID=UPI00352874A1
MRPKKHKTPANKYNLEECLKLDALGKKQFFENGSKFARSGINTPFIFKKFLSSSLSLDETVQQTEENTYYTACQLE